MYDRKAFEIFEKVPFSQGWSNRNGNPTSFTFDKGGIPRRQGSPHLKGDRRVTFKLPADIPIDRWIHSSADNGRGKWRSFEPGGKQRWHIESNSKCRSEKPTCKRITKGKIPCLDHSGENTKG